METTCKHTDCLLKSDCAITGCLLHNPLITHLSKEIYEKLKQCEPAYRLKYIISVLQQKQPPKVNRTQIDRYYSLLRHGFDMDRNWNNLSPGFKVTQLQVVHKPRQRNFVLMNQAKKINGVIKKAFAEAKPWKKNKNHNPPQRLDKSGKPVIVIKQDVINEK